MLRRVDPDRGIARCYSHTVERDLCGAIRLVNNWGRIGTNGQELVEVFADEIEAGRALGECAGEAAAGVSRSVSRNYAIRGCGGRSTAILLAESSPRSSSSQAILARRSA